MLKAQKAKIRAAEKVNSPKLVKSAYQDAFGTSEYLLIALIKMGEMLAGIPLNIESSGRGKIVNKPSLPKGISYKESHRAQTFFTNSDKVEEIRINIMGKQRIPTPEEIYREIKKQKNPPEILSLSNPPKIHHESYETWIPKQPQCDLLLTDPPYMTDVDDIGKFAKEWIPIAFDKIKPSGRVYICIGAYPEEIEAYLVVCKKSWLKVSNIIVWTYQNTLGPSPSHDYKLNWQAILYFRGPDAPPLKCPQMLEQFTVQNISAPDGRQGDRYHEWQKPLELAERFIRHSTEEGQIILDPFVGTGTFILAANKLGRIGKGCDIDKVALDIAKKRGCEFEPPGSEETECSTIEHSKARRQDR